MKLVELFFDMANLLGNFVYYLLMFITGVIVLAIFGWENILLFGLTVVVMVAIWTFVPFLIKTYLLERNEK